MVILSVLRRDVTRRRRQSLEKSGKARSKGRGTVRKRTQSHGCSKSGRVTNVNRGRLVSRPFSSGEKIVEGPHTPKKTWEAACETKRCPPKGQLDDR